MHETDFHRRAVGSVHSPHSARDAVVHPPSLQRSISTTTSHSTRRPARRSSSKDIRLRSHTSCESMPDMISPEEYAALPPSIQYVYLYTSLPYIYPRGGSSKQRSVGSLLVPLQTQSNATVTMMKLNNAASALIPRTRPCRRHPFPCSTRMLINVLGRNTSRPRSDYALLNSLRPSSGRSSSTAS